MTRKTFAVLIVGYQRVEAIQSILEKCLEAEINCVLLSIDFPKVQTPESLSRNAQIRDLASKFEPHFDSFKARFLDKNIGCSANVLSSCDWAFDQYKEVAVLEDDCQPSVGFFDYCEESKNFLKSRSEVLLACGTQFVPADVKGSSAYLSKYVLTWGWFTDREHWETIKRELTIHSQAYKRNKLIFSNERIYWREGARRAFEGYVDVWDTPLVYIMNEGSYFSLLPPTNLISNIGNDSVATHTRSDKVWTNAITNDFSQEDFGIPRVNIKADLWLKKNLYKIRFRHFISTNFTKIQDRFRAPKYAQLLIRWDYASKL